ncbi:MAG: hypothetical protein COT81_04630 [Candidatus Buchananbacteria bacterium CG10_big_fil_rev_8_21_14_0_10_42_9]|uniref:Glycosyl transferase family 1 domain-containing protein n=1 Tax=Candidatus Buchananbacteria bacterium CG10_big_fil_rev_8_21_14_0_10_42_9 TaxID=1974526 RepID=A0A2H0W0A0_9BACT|nr:MAG: hypothetical protein COT81_04630 [Candidatus Buchananbacteria bacterium CG10_big_fil_rev_8_21_14_0_10_42_9]
MTICVVAYKFGTEKEIGEHLGSYHYFIQKMRVLVEKGHKVFVVAPWLSFTKKGSENIDGVKVIRYYPPMLNKAKVFPVNRIIRWVYIKQTQRQVLKLDQQENLDVVYVWQARETGYAISKIKSKLKAPFIFRQITAWHWHFNRPIQEILAHDTLFKIMAKLSRSLANQFGLFLLDRKTHKKYADVIYEKADKIVFLSQAAIEEGKKLGLDESKAEIIGVAIEEDEFKPMHDKRSLRQKLGLDDKLTILFVGRVNFAEKGVGILLEASTQARKKINDFQLILIGGGEDDKMKSEIDKLSIMEIAKPIGKKSFSELVEYINAADAVVVPSIWMEAFGMITIEAMSCGVPVITSDAGASPEININDETGFVVPKNNAEALSQAIVKMLKDKPMREKFGKQARERVLQNYTYEVLVNKFLNIVQHTRQ